MADNSRSEGLGDDLLEQILGVPEGPVGMLQLGSTTAALMPLGLNLEQTSFLRHHHQDSTNLVDATTIHNHLTLTPSSSPSSTGPITVSILHYLYDFFFIFYALCGMQGRDIRGLFSPFPQMHTPPTLHPHLHHNQPQQAFQGQAAVAAAPMATTPQPPGIRPRVRARRGQATDPHSIAERLRRERIAERMKALQELVPTINKTDRAAMLDEIVDYVKFLRLQVKVLSMSRLGGAGAVAQLVADVPLSAVEGEEIEGGGNEQAWDKWSNDGTEQQVAKLMEEDVGAAMQFLQSKALCIMPISLASAIFRIPQSEASTVIKPESNSH